MERDTLGPATLFRHQAVEREKTNPVSTLYTSHTIDRGEVGQQLFPSLLVEIKGARVLELQTNRILPQFLGLFVWHERSVSAGYC